MVPITHIFDACALIAYLRKEPGHEVAIEVLTTHLDSCATHAVNACEIYYDCLRVSGAATAADIWTDLDRLGILLSPRV